MNERKVVTLDTVGRRLPTNLSPTGFMFGVRTLPVVATSPIRRNRHGSHGPSVVVVETADAA